MNLIQYRGSINHNGSLFDDIEDLERFALQEKTTHSEYQEG
jgi:methyl coenzyme M reductase subunit C-like uncharacterized protein (methanogenesis marker protein 7)